MLKTWLMARSRNKCIFAILLAVLVFFILPFLWLIKDEVRMMLVENPETCALCDGQPHDVPCLLDINRGQVGELVKSPDGSNTWALPAPWAGGIPTPRPAGSPSPRKPQLSRSPSSAGPAGGRLWGIPPPSSTWRT